MNLEMRVESYAALYHLARSGYGISEDHANQIKHWFNEVCEKKCAADKAAEKKACKCHC